MAVNEELGIAAPLSRWLKAHPGLDQALDSLREGDTLAAWKQDRLGRSVKGLLDFAGGLNERRIGFLSFTVSIDTTTVTGHFFLYVTASPARME